MHKGVSDGLERTFLNHQTLFLTGLNDKYGELFVCPNIVAAKLL
jgi:hypothetical protein